MNTSPLRALILALPLAFSTLFAAPAQAAKWTPVGPDSPSVNGKVVRIDLASVKSDANGGKAWTLVSYDKPQSTTSGKSYLSMKALHQYACEDRTTTLLVQVYYPGPMGEGEEVEHLKFEKFAPEDIVPDSVTDATLKLVCRAKKTP